MLCHVLYALFLSLATFTMRLCKVLSLRRRKRRLFWSVTIRCRFTYEAQFAYHVSCFHFQVQCFIAVGRATPTTQFSASSQEHTCVACCRGTAEQFGGHRGAESWPILAALVYSIYDIIYDYYCRWVCENENKLEKYPELRPNFITI